MRIVVTGANGLVGSRLAAQLLEQGHSVVGLGRGPKRLPAAVEYRSVELTRETEVAEALAAAKPEVIVHTASMTNVDDCERNPLQAYAANGDASAFVALGARKAGAHLIHVSTDYVFDGDAGPYSEEDIPNPRGIYALSKYAGEIAVRSLASSWAIARTAVVYGWPPAEKSNFGSWLVGALEKKQPVKLFVDQYVSPSLADNVAGMLAELAGKKATGIWNTCGSEVVNRVEYGQALCRVFGFDPALLQPSKMKDVNLPSPRPLKSGLKTAKAARELATQPLGLAASLERFHRAYRGK